MQDTAEDSLQEAGAALRRAVEVLRRRPVDDLAAKALVGEFHELRTVMSTATLLMQSFGLPRFAELDRIQAEPDQASVGLLEEADADLTAASDHLSRAAGCLTSARQKLDTLR